jgi:hypothetical protein
MGIWHAIGEVPVSKGVAELHCVGRADDSRTPRWLGMGGDEGTRGRTIPDGTTQYDTAAQLESNAKKCHTHDGYAVISRRERVSLAAGGPTGRGQPEARIVPGIRQR